MDGQTVGRQCVGRFQMMVPETLSVAGRRQAIYRVDVSTIPLPKGGIEALWEDRISRIRTLPPPRGIKQVLMRTFEVMPGAPAVLYFRSAETPDLVALEAVRASGSHAVIANRGADLNAEQREALLKATAPEGLARLVQIVLSAYVSATERGFCIGDGAIVTPKPAVNEDALLSLAHRGSPNVKIRFETRTVAEPDTRSYSNLDEERQVSGPGTRITVLRDQDRVVAGLTGKEIRAAVAPDKQPPFVRFTWHFPGVPGRSDQPLINVVGTALQREQTILEGAWEALLSSLRPIPF